MTRCVSAVALLTSALGCASNESSINTAPTAPQPSTFSLSATLTTDLPAELSANTGMPSKLRGSLDAKAQAEAISRDPLRSSYTGTMSLVITNDEKTRTFIDLDITVDGASDGAPSNALADAFERFLQAARAMVEPSSNILAPNESP